jgi:predicted ATP-grasp superfamily ATP-dependent carboligase
VGFLPGGLEVPAGTQGALEHAFGEVGVPAVGLWARVPHYASAMPYPAASAALVEELARIGELDLDTKALRAAAAATFNQIETLIAGSEEHRAMVHQLEAQHDHEATSEMASTLGTDLPSGDEIAAELERFLRGEH